MRHNFDAWLPNLRAWEGFLSNDSRDPGGETAFGISRRYHPGAFANWRKPKWEEAEAFYLNLWVNAGCDDLPFPMDVCHADSTVNPGPKGAKQLLIQSSEHADPYIRATEYLVCRIDYYLDRVGENPTKLSFLRGWMKRTTQMFRWAIINKWSVDTLKEV